MSSQKWYFEDHGRAKGPISTTDLVQKIQKGDLNLLDLIFKEGDKQWNPLEHYTEVTDLIGNVTVREESDWILLRTLEVDGKQRYEQIGPFNIDQVLELVDKGKATFNDYVWRTGFDSWVSLGKVDKFEKPLSSSVKVDVSLYKMPRHEILDKVPPVPVKAYSPIKKIKSREEEPPPEAKGADLARPAWMVDPGKTAVQQREKPKTDKEKKVAPSEHAVEQLAKTKAVPEVAIPSVEKKSVVIERVEAKPVARVQEKSVEKNASLKTSKTESSGEAAPLKLEEKHTETRRDLVTEVRPTDQRPIKVSVKKTDPIAPPVISSSKASINKEESTADVIALPNPESVEKMRRRWGTVGLYVGLGSVCGGLVLLAVLALSKSRYATDDVLKLPQQMRDKPAAKDIYQPDVLPPSEDDFAQEIPVKAEVPKPTTAPVSVDPVVRNTKNIKPEVKVPDKVEIPEVEKKEIFLETQTSTEIAKMEFKQRAIFHNSERKFIFYSTQRAIDVATNLSALYRKKGKSGLGWRSGYLSWQNSLRAMMSGELKSNQPRLYPDMYNRLRKNLVSLDQRAKEFDSQLLSGRNPTKELTFDEIIQELKSLNAKARSLDL